MSEYYILLAYVMFLLVWFTFASAINVNFITGQPLLANNQICSFTDINTCISIVWNLFNMSSSFGLLNDFLLAFGIVIGIMILMKMKPWGSG